MQRIYRKRIIAIILLLISVIAVAEFMQLTVANSDNADYRNLKCFYKEEPDSLDAVVMGASEVVNGYSAAEAYRTEGFTSYPFAISVNSVFLWKYELKEIEKRQHPNLLIVEINGAVYLNDKQLHSEYCINNFLDSMPLSVDKVKAAYALSENPIERIFPIIKYHFKWPKLRRLADNTNLMLQTQGHAKLRGAYNFTYRDEIEDNTTFRDDQDISPLNEEAEQTLREFLELCKESEIKKIVFVEYPHLICDEDMHQRRRRSNKVAEIIKDTGFEYIDINSLADEIELDYPRDFHDPDHMIASGQKKTSDYIARLIRTSYLDELKPQTDRNRADWDESADLILKYYDLNRRYLEENSGKKDGFVRPRIYEDRDLMRKIGQ